MNRLLLLFSICFYYTCNAQVVGIFDTLKSVLPVNRIYVAEEIYNKQRFDTLEFAKAIPSLNQLRNIAEKLDDIPLQVFAQQLFGRYYYDRPRIYEPRGIAYDIQGISMAHKYNLPIQEAKITHALGSLYYRMEQYPKAFEYLLKANDMIKDIGYDKFPDAGHYLYDLGYTYSDFDEYDKCRFYLKEALRHPLYNLWYTIRIYNVLGLSYRHTKQYDSSIIYFQKAIDAAREQKDSASIGFLIGNIGDVYFLENKYTEALPYMQADYSISMRHKQWLSAEGDLCTLADIDLFENKISPAEKKLFEARQLLHLADDIRRRRDIYKGLAKLYSIKKDYTESYLYLDSFMVYKDSLAKRNDVKMLNRIEVSLQIQKHQAEVQLLQSQKSRELVIRDAIIVAFILIVALALQEVFRQRLKQKKNKEIFALEKQRAESEKERTEQELKNAENLLVSYVDSVREKNQLIEQFTAEISHLQSLPNSPIQVEKTETLEKLIHATILTENDWNKFKELFDKAYKNFFVKLKMKYPDLTQAEVRLLALTKLNLSTKEMANMLGISPDSIRKSRYRLCKKIDLPEESALKDILTNI